MVDFVKLKELTKEMSVLYVEDDQLIREEVGKFLSRLFATVDLAEDGQEGLELYKNGNYDIVISDINMPKMNGIEMSKSIFKEEPNQSIVIISAHNESEYLLALINSGIEYYALKPINMDKLGEIIYKIIEPKQHDIRADSYQEKIYQKNLKLEKILEEKTEIINRNIHTDSLTGLHNLFSCINTIKKNSSDYQNFTVLILIELDSLTDINALYSHDVGNKILIDFAKFLKNFIKDKSYKIFRISGGQFVLLDQVKYRDNAKFEYEFKDLQEQIKAYNIYVDEIDKELNVNATIGISFGHECPLEQADIALKSAKQRHKPYLIYDALLDIEGYMKEKLEWSHRIYEAIKDDKIVPVFQPIVDNKGAIVKYESLMRVIIVEDGEEKLVSPDNFLEFAFEDKYYIQLSSIIINSVFDSFKVHSHTLSINLSYADIEDEIFIETLYKRIENENIGDRLIVEITENEKILDYQKLKKSIEKFRKLGVKIAIDDFGSGYSNFNHILEMRPEYIKIDGTLVKDIDTNARSLILTKAIATFCRELGITVIAEYVHSKEVYDILKKFEIDEFQGFYFSEPLRGI